MQLIINKAQLKKLDLVILPYAYGYWGMKGDVNKEVPEVINSLIKSKKIVITEH